MKKLKAGKRHLEWEDGTPFFYAADTAWMMPHMLTRPDMEEYFSVRASQGYNAFQVSLLAELCDTAGGIDAPNRYGDFPLKNRDPAAPDTDGGYWALVDDMLDMAEERGMLAAVLPTWGDKLNSMGREREIFTPENAYTYGLWLGRRYAAHEALIWVLGGDRPLKTAMHHKIIDNMARGLREGDGGTHLMTFHPSGAASSVDFVPAREYIDFHSVQSGHGMECYESHEYIRRTLRAEAKPCMDMECRYEDFPACFNLSLGYRWDAADIRNNFYRNMLEGACGVTYGHQSVWRFHEGSAEYPFSWREALKRPAAYQTAYVSRLRIGRDFSSFRPAPEILRGSGETGAGHVCAARGDDYAYVYSPLGAPLNVDFFAGSEGECKYTPIKASWLDPRTGTEAVFGLYTADTRLYVPPSSGKGQDWVLILEEIGKC